MIWLLYLIPAAIAAWVVVSRYGWLAGGATAVAVLIAQTAILSRLAKRDASVEPRVDRDAAQFKRLAVPGDARHLFDELRHVIEQYADVDAGTDGSTATATGDDDALVVFRSPDRAWSGLRCGGDSFRFRHGAITTLGIFAIDSIRKPGTGSCQGLLWFDVKPRNQPPEVNDPYMKRAFFALGPDCRDSLEPMRAWAPVLEEIATMLGAKFDVVVHSDV
ncbi:hypothetical protein WI72_24865 [Burkholderia ubonensis]|uniref:hypothetical protein n=1 Tax=Burkholderia ubonensis TaxID=101571 RepID=UPI00075F0A69|nr:hypothetical protein [Burkholderia ubonensis]KVC51617.1 hypothetical protein WI72_24865 [Burkholderia ubonensis]KVD96719.1 hypothetical protein WI90_02560 [Burkholderia ubonensis]